MRNKYIKKSLFVLLIVIVIILISSKILFHYYDYASNNEFFLNGLLRVILILITIYLIFTDKIVNQKYLFRNNFIVLPIVATLIYYSLSNTFLKINSGEYEISNYRHYVYLFKNFAIGFFEELLFRVLIFSYMFKIFENVKINRTTKVFITTSIIFGLIHFLNLTKNNFEIIPVLNQVFLAMILGLIFQFILLRLDNIILISVIHGLIDYHGVLNSSLLRISRESSDLDSGSSYFGALILLAIFIFILIPITYFSLKNQEIKLIRSDN